VLEGTRPLPVPATVRERITQRVEALAPLQRAVLTTLAVAGRACRTSVISHVHGISRLRAAVVGDALVERHLAVEEGGAYRCARRHIAVVVREGLTTARRREEHCGLARVLGLLARIEGEPPDRAAIARHARSCGKRRAADAGASPAVRARTPRVAYEESPGSVDRRPARVGESGA
jgi:hypothetical protein